MNRGYYDTRQAITDFGYIDGMAFIADHPEMFAVGQDSRDPSAFQDAYARMNGGPTNWLPKGTAGREGPGEMQEFTTDLVGDAIITLRDGATTAYGTYGGIYWKYYLLGRGSSVLGYPKSDEGDTYPSPYPPGEGTSGRYTLFDNGTINYNSRTHETHEVHGPNFEYFKLAGYSSWHGFPTSDVFEWNGSQRTDVEEGGYIYTDPYGVTRFSSPTAPRGLHIINATAGVILIGWNCTSDIETGFVVTKITWGPANLASKRTGTSRYFETYDGGVRELEPLVVESIPLPANTSEYSDTDVAAGGIYTYSVVGSYNASNSPVSNEIVAGAVVAASILVPDDCPTIQCAIDSAEAGDTILVRPGTYVETTNVTALSPVCQDTFFRRKSHLVTS